MSEIYHGFRGTWALEESDWQDVILKVKPFVLPSIYSQETFLRGQSRSPNWLYLQELKTLIQWNGIFT